VSGKLHAPADLPPGKSPRYPFYRRLGGPQSRSGRYGEVKIFYPTGNQTPAPPGRPARSQSLYRLSFPGSNILSCICLKPCQTPDVVVPGYLQRYESSILPARVLRNDDLPGHAEDNQKWWARVPTRLTATGHSRNWKHQRVLLDVLSSMLS
jgi:hypothetical protein